MASPVPPPRPVSPRGSPTPSPRAGRRLPPPPPPAATFHPVRPTRALPTPPPEDEEPRPAAAAAAAVPAQRLPRFTPPLDVGVAELLRLLDLGRYAPYFEAEEIDTAALLLLEDGDVEELLVREKDLLRAALRCVPWSSVSRAEPGPPPLEAATAAAVRQILQRPEGEQAWRAATEMLEQLAAKLALLETLFVAPVQRMVLEPGSGVTSRAVEALFFRVSIMLTLTREFAETRDLHVGQTLFNVVLLYLRNLETAIVLFFALCAENARFAALVADIEADNLGDKLEHLLMVPLYCSLSVDRLMQRVAAAECRRADAAALQRLAQLAEALAGEARECAAVLRNQDQVREVELRLARPVRVALAAAGRRFLHEGALMVARGASGRLEQFYAFLLSDALVLATQGSDLQFRHRETLPLEGAPGEPLCVERVADELGDFGVRLRSVHAAALSLAAEGTRFYASSREELDEWIDKGFARAVAAAASAGPALPRTPSSAMTGRKARDGGGSLSRQKSGGNILAKGLEIIRHKSGNKSPRAGVAAVFE